MLFRKLVLDLWLDNATVRNTAKNKFLKPARWHQIAEQMVTGCMNQSDGPAEQRVSPIILAC
jgi:hypothetical protein